MADIQLNKTVFFLIIGLGNIGKRHLESLLRVKNSFIYLKDVNEENITNILIQYSKKKIKKISNLNEIKTKIDLAIIATNSDQRPKALSELIKYSKIKNIILEKIVFQKLQYFKKFLNISKKKKINIFVNHPRRFWKIFQKIKNEIEYNKSNFEIAFKSKDWGICCNSIHFIDLLFFLSFEKINVVHHYNFLQKKIYTSKRKGFYELKGKINFECNNNNKLVLIDDNKLKKNIFTIKFANIVYNFETNENNFTIQKIKNSITISKEKFIYKIPKQSELTQKYFYCLIHKKLNFLTSLEESYVHHKIFFNSIKENFRLKDKNLFPIT